MSRRASTLVIGLGNALMGGDGAGGAAAERLRSDPRLPADVTVVAGGTDLLRLERQIEGRSRVILVDALLDPTHSGAIRVVRDCFGDFKSAQEHAHALSAVQAIELLRLVNPDIRSVAFTLIGIPVPSASLEAALPPALEDVILRAVDRVLEELSQPSV